LDVEPAKYFVLATNPTFAVRGCFGIIWPVFGS
jgi:hypothetical protein